jgi:hypothetical protein
MNLPENNLEADENLDRAIHAALQVDTDQRSLARLEQFWRRQSRRERWRRRATYAIPLAAAAALAAVAFFVASRNDPTDGKRALVIHAPVRAAPEAGETQPMEEFADTRQSSSAGRPPTVYEQFLFAAQAKATGPAESRIAAVGVAIDRLIEQPDADEVQTLDATKLNPDYAERLLLRELSKSDNAECEAILRLLAVCGTERSVPALLKLGQREALREATLATIELIVDVEKLPDVIRNSANSRLRLELMRRLLARNTQTALIAYLSLVHDEATSRIALALVEETPRLPVTALLAALDHQDRSIRQAAALVLGRANDAEVTKLLIARVTGRPSDSTEAWLALMVSRGALASEFLVYASHRPQLLGHFNAARVQWGQSIP